MNEPTAHIAQDIRNEKSVTSSLEISFWGFLRYIISKWLIIGLVAFAAGVFGFFYAAKQKVKYESNLTFVLDQGSGESGISGALSIAAQFGLNVGGSNNVFSGDNILEIMKSRRIVEQVMLSVDTFGNKPVTLIDHYLTEEAAPGKVHFPVGVNKAALNYAQDSVLFHSFQNFVSSDLVVDRPDRKLDIFSIRVQSADEKFAKVFTDKLIHATDSFYTEISSKKEKETLEILEKRVAAMKGNLSASISDRASVQDANLNPAFSAAQVPLQKQQANIQVYGGAYGEMFKNLELARFQYLKKIPLIQIVDAADYPMKKIKMGKVKTAIFFAFGAAFFVIFIFWLIRLYKLNR